MEIKSEFSAEEVLEKVLQIEDKIGRIRSEKWGERIIDIDILLFNDLIVEKEGMPLPRVSFLGKFKTAFQIGFMLFIPFIVIDLVVSNILLSLGMFMLSPVMISLPFKILLFVLVDGWNLITRGLLNGFQ